MFIFWTHSSRVGSGKGGERALPVDNVMALRRRRFENYMLTSANRSGPGEHGKSHYLTGKDRDKGHEIFAEEGFNWMVSDEISLDRDIPDTRRTE